MEDRIRPELMQQVAAMPSPRETVSPGIEKFTVAELTSLRNELLSSQLDSWQAADVAASFLAGHGYGASADHLRTAISRLELSRCSIDCLQAELERVAYIQ